MTQCCLIGSYEKEKDFIKELNEFIAGWSYDNLEIQYQMTMTENHVLYSALVITKDCR